MSDNDNDDLGNPPETRKSSRPNKGNPPAKLNAYYIGGAASSSRASLYSNPESDKDDDFNGTIIQKTIDVESIVKELQETQRQLKESQLLHQQETEDRERYINQLIESMNKITVNANTGTKPKIKSTSTQCLNTLNQFEQTATEPVSRESTAVNNVISNVYQNVNQRYGKNGYESNRKLHDLPEFNGKPEEWPMFIVSYRESTAAYRYTDLENTIRLQKCLRGDAKSSVQSMLIFPQNVEAVLEQLEFLYGRPEYLIKSQIEEVRKILPVDEKQLHLIMPFATKVRNLSTFLETIDSPQHLGNPILMESLIEKLPMSMRLDWIKFSLSIKPYATVTHFSDWVNQEARLISRAVVSTIPTINETRYQSDRKQGKKNIMLHTQNNQEQPKLVRCIFCDSDHYITDCGKFSKKSSDDKWKFVKMKRLCFCCLRFGHNTFNCRKRKVCGENGCIRSHHKLLHEDESTSTSSPIATSEPRRELLTVNENTSNNTVLSCKSVSFKPPKSVLFKVIPIEILGPEKCIKTYAMIDEGSSVTLVEEDLANELNLDAIKTSNLNLQWFGDQTSSQLSKLIPIVKIRGMSEKSDTVTLQNVRTIKNLRLPAQSLKLENLNKRYHHLKHLPIADYVNAKPSLLIGIDNSQVGLPYQIKSSGIDEPIVIKTKLGWIVYGQMYDLLPSINRNISLHMRSVNMEDLHNLVKEYFTTENFGVMKPEVEIQSSSDARALQLLKTTTVRNENSYETGLLWKTDHVVLPNSYPMALRRLNGLEKKMQKDSEFAVMYIKNMRSYVEKGYARRMTIDEINSVTTRTWYLPHFGVKNVSKPNKLRIVFDAAASVDGVSLNSMLLSGPDQYQPLAAILHRFRQGKIAVCGDIKEMFSQIRIRKQDRDSQRFIWRENKCQPIETYVMVSMIFGATCSPCSAQFVKNKNASDFVEQFPEAVKSIKENHYVDDFVQSFANEEVAIAISNAVIDIHRQGGFELCKFVSNSKKVENTLNGTENESEGIVDMNIASQSTDKILGMHWNTTADEFRFKLNFVKVKEEVMNGIRSPTKRELLSVLMSIFDPFGLIANFVIYCKILLQDLWKSGTDWDDVIPESINQKWMLWQKEIQKVRNFCIPRNYSPNLMNAVNIELHVFVDASESAFAAVSYIRFKSIDNWEVVFVAGKTKCAPQKILSVPRLELQAAVLGVRLKNAIVDAHEFHIDKFIFWSDSSTVIHWIRSDQRKYKPFVAHRIAEVLESTDVNNWKWLSTKLNTADEGTRALHPPNFEINNRWITGPDFLKQDENYWPNNNLETSTLDNSDKEMKHNYVFLLGTEDKIISLERLSTFTKAKRVVAWILRFVKNCKVGKINGFRGELAAHELDVAEKHLCRIVQQEVYSEELGDLQAGRDIQKSSKIFQLSPYLDSDNLIRINGRINNAPGVDSYVRRPIIIPKEHRLTELIVAHYHVKMAHQNQETVICEIRRKFWIIHIRVLVKKAKRTCQVCKIRSAMPKTPQMGQLPRDRLTPFVRPFTYTGLDFFGPVLVSIGRRQEKRWVALFTCLSIRAIHLEIARDLSTDAVIICLRNFINRRGVPVRIRCDNGTNFIGADNELRDLSDFLDVENIKGELANRNIEWVFNCPSNPNAGGCWERLVQSVKKVLKHTLKEKAPQFKTLQSLLIEAENIVNCRPLTHVPVESDEDAPITPNHFLIGTANSTQTPNDSDEQLFRYRKQWRIAQQLKNNFWHIWMKEYLPALTRRVKWFGKVEPLKVGDLVLICDFDIPRNGWLRGRIVDVVQSKDGQIRYANVKTSNGILKRPASKLAVLDVQKSKSLEAIYGGGDVSD